MYMYICIYVYTYIYIYIYDWPPFALGPPLHGMGARMLSRSGFPPPPCRGMGGSGLPLNVT